MIGLGLPIGLNDRNGNPIHIGDTMSMDEVEYGAENEFVIELKEGEIVHLGGKGDLSNWCEIVKPWTEIDGEAAKLGVCDELRRINEGNGIYALVPNEFHDDPCWDVSDITLGSSYYGDHVIGRGATPEEAIKAAAKWIEAHFAD